MTNPEMHVETRERELIFTRHFEAPRELVFQAYSSCEHLKHWWGPRSWPMVECVMDFRVGGLWQYCLRGPNEGDESWGKAVYQEIVDPERIVYTDYFTDKEGKISPEMPQVLSTCEFADVNGKTQLTVRAQYLTPSQLKTVVEMGMIEGLTETLDRLEEHLRQLVESK